MNLQNKFSRTGKMFLTLDVDRGHKKGILCLSCGIFCGGLWCAKCVEFDKCKLCGILCKATPTNVLYIYQRKQGNRNVCEELSQEVKTICEKLEDKLCEDCVLWETRIKNECFVCGGEFNNFYKNFRENGNCCIKCALKLAERYKTIDKEGNPRNMAFNRFKEHDNG